MSISTGDSGRSTPKKSTTPAAAGSPDPEETAGPADGPVGGVLPVKPLKRAAKSANGGAGRTASNGSGRTSAGTSRTSGSAAGAAKSTGNGAARAKTTPAKTTAAKTTPAKTTPAKTTGTRSTGTKPALAKASTSVTEEVEGGGLFSGRSTTKPAAKATKSRPPSALGGGGKGPKGRRAAPVKVAQTRNWGPIALFVATGVAALLIVGYGVWPVISESFKPSWQEQAASIDGIRNYLDTESEYFNQAVASGQHQAGDLAYPMAPAVGGTHNARWQNCMGDIYPSEIAEEHAVHSLEHGAVWITYRPDLDPDQIDELADRIRDVEYTLMSPYPNLDAPISLQAWGYQVKVDNADDGRIDDFINALRRNATQEDGASCSGGITDATPTPLDLGGM